jgi:MFS family permease
MMNSEEAVKKENIMEEEMEEGQDAPAEAVEAPAESEGLLKDEGDGVMKDDVQTENAWSEWLRKSTRPMLPRRYKLVTEHDALTRSIRSVRLAVMTSAINTKMLNPNYPIMVTPGAHDDSFPDTEPFEFNSATYFLPMCSLLGVAIASIFLGTISDKVGRKKVILVLAWVSCAGSIAKYFARETFWGFCITQFVFGFFLGNLPVGMAYIGDVFTSKKTKSKELGMLVAYYVIGNSGGGVIAILMNGSGLFAPLWVGAAIIGLSAVYTSWYMIEPGDVRLIPVGEASSSEDEEEVPRPETIDQKNLWNIVAGALADNFGSTGLFPLCLSPLAIEKFLFDFVDAEPPEVPIMEFTGYQWLSVMVAGMVVPATMMTPWVFRKLGVAGTCVFGNAFTALLTFALLMIGNAVS